MTINKSTRKYSRMNPYIRRLWDEWREGGGRYTQVYPDQDALITPHTGRPIASASRRRHGRKLWRYMTRCHTGG